MAANLNALLDPTGVAILEELQRDARVSYSELARRIGLSTPATVERIRKLEDAGIIAGYGVRLNLEALGFGVTALIEVKTDPTRYERVREFARTTLEVRECYFVTGESSFVTRVVVRNIGELQALIERIGLFGSTRTSLALSSPILKDQFDVGASRPSR
jgi:Lrp/AsnC family transcriptional regulator, leucine-responsive regulatory protein